MRPGGVGGPPRCPGFHPCPSELSRFRKGIIKGGPPPPLPHLRLVPASPDQRPQPAGRSRRGPAQPPPSLAPSHPGPGSLLRKRMFAIPWNHSCAFSSPIFYVMGLAGCHFCAPASSPLGVSVRLQSPIRGCVRLDRGPGPRSVCLHPPAAPSHMARGSPMPSEGGLSRERRLLPPLPQGEGRGGRSLGFCGVQLLSGPVISEELCLILQVNPELTSTGPRP